MRVFVYEHVTGGGMRDDPLAASLAPEGEMMLRALVDDLAAVPGVEVVTLLDPRLDIELAAKIHRLAPGSDFWSMFRRAAHDAEAVWPIAPEQGGMLARLTQEVVGCGRVLLNSRLAAVRVAASKRATVAALQAAGVPAIPVLTGGSELAPEIEEVVVKPDDGAGCQDTLLFRSRDELRAWMQQSASSQHVVQPFVHGDAFSVSALFCEGRGRLLACNRQYVSERQGRLHFEGVRVNARQDPDGRYRRLVAEVARALPGLWGYAGIDFIGTESGPLVVEVNPRLTTSYAGLRRAIGANPARMVLELPDSLDESFWPLRLAGQPVDVEVAHA
jgi:predicted ATP-grasp superfamily ATP-dependent carboligase